MAETILIVDDEPAILDLVDYHLKAQGFFTLCAQDGPSALEVWEKERPDLVVLDVMLPGMDGLAVCRAIRRHSQTPVILLTARGEEIDRVLGLELGADDYMVKPFSPRELVARIRAILRRSQELQGKDLVRAGDMAIDLSGQKVTVNGKSVSLTFTEFSLLRCLAENKGRVLTRPFLLEKVWGFDFYGDSRTVDVHVRHLREKLETDPANPNLIETVRGVGYRLRNLP